jgi:transcriptional regulator with XRE-family HTH domain
MTEDKIQLTHDIGTRLRAARHAQELSLSELSERTGGELSKSRISNYEQGLRRMGIEEARALAAALGSVSATYLLCLEDDAQLSDEERQLVERYRKAKPKMRASVRELIGMG